MGSYPKSVTTKELIINLARKFFWEKGFEQTRYNDLSDSGINPGLIHYYFKTKESLASIIYNDLVEQCSSFIFEIIDNPDDILLHITGSAIVVWKFLDASSNFRRFYSEIANHRILISGVLEQDLYSIKELNKEYHLNLRDSEIILLNRICASISNELVISFVNNQTNISADDLAVYETKSTFRIIGIDEELVNDTLKKVEAIFCQYDFYMEDNFKMCYRHKDSESQV